MKRAAVIILALLVAGLMVGCGGGVSKVPVAVTGPDGKVLKDKDGNPIIKMAEITGEKAHYSAYEAKDKNRRPQFELVAAKDKDGNPKDITLSGLAALKVWGADPTNGQIPAYLSQETRQLKDVTDKALWPLTILGFKWIDAKYQQPAQATYQFKDSFNPSGGSGNTWAPASKGAFSPSFNYAPVYGATE
ncbi:MAG: hypothetical protein ABIK12_10770 [Pseudomonadota bacterium]